MLEDVVKPVRDCASAGVLLNAFDEEGFYLARNMLRIVGQHLFDTPITQITIRG